MRKVLISLFFMALIAGLLFADIEVNNDYEANFTTATQASNEVATVIQIAGYLEQIDFVPTGTFTAKVAVTYTPYGGAAVNIYTNDAMTAQTVIRPAVDRTDTAGASLTGDDPTRYLLNGGTLTITVTNVNKTAATKLTAVVKTEK